MPDRAPWSRATRRQLHVYISLVWVLAASLAVVSIVVFGPPSRWGVIAALALLTMGAWALTSAIGDVNVSPTTVALLSAIALLAPAGAGIVAGAAFLLLPKVVAIERRVFNAAMFSVAAMLGGMSYMALGGTHQFADLHEPGLLLREVGLPMAVADVVQLVANGLLVCGVLRITEGIPVRVQFFRLLRGTGLTYFAHGALAFLLVVLWMPLGLSWFSVVLIIAPLLAAAWAYRQYGEEHRSHELGLDVLVAALETRAPHLTGHSARVAELSGAIAEELGMPEGEITEIRHAGMLHDLGQVTLPRRVLTAIGDSYREEFATYPSRGAELLGGLTFLSGATEIVAQHADPPPGDPTRGVTGAEIVHVADRYDLVTRVDGLDGVRLEPDAAREAIGAGGSDQVLVILEALRRVQLRTAGVLASPEEDR